MAKQPSFPINSSDAEAERHRLTEDVLKFIEAGVDSDVPDFNDYALRMFAFHYQVNPIFHEFCEAKKVRPGDISDGKIFQWSTMTSSRRTLLLPSLSSSL